MKLSVGLLLFTAGLSLFGAEYATPATPETGSQLAGRIRSMAPTNNSEIHGTLEIKYKKNLRKIPVIFSVIVRDGTWDTVYSAAATTHSGAERLVITHSETGANHYLHARAASPSDSLPELKTISLTNVATIPFAGSDFSIGDLGLEFLHWPEQTRLANATRFGQPCYVLESVNTNEPEIVRVRSFFLMPPQSPALLGADAYDHKRAPSSDPNQLGSKEVRTGRDTTVKEFSIQGSKIKNGQMEQVLTLSNNKTGSESTLRFNLDAPH